MYALSNRNKEYFLELSYKKLKVLTDIDSANWSNWFNGKNTPTLESLERVAEALEIPLTELVEAFVERRSRTMQSKEAKSA